MGSLKKSLLTFAAAVLASPLAHAADFGPLPQDPGPAQVDQRAEFGTGWYLRGDIGWTRDSGLKVDNVGQIVTSGTRNGWVADLGAGYQFNNWVRTDATLETRNFTRSNGVGPLQISGVAGANPCQISATPVLNGVGTVIGSTPVYLPCANHYRSRLAVNALLFNGYIDLGTWSSITPYVGAGIGAARVRSEGTNKWFANDGITAYNSPYTDPYTLLTYRGSRDLAYKKNTYNLAWALMAGAAIDVSPHVKLDLGYRYANYGTYKAPDLATGNFVSKKITAQEFRAGIRYMID